MGLSNLQKLGTIVSQLPFLRETPEFSGHKDELDDIIYRLKEILYSAESKEKEITVLEEDLEKLLDYAIELNAGRKEISAIATLIALCRMV